MPRPSDSRDRGETLPSPEDQVRIAELVPEISPLTRLGIRALQVGRTPDIAADRSIAGPIAACSGRDLLDQRQMGGTELVEPRTISCVDSGADDASDVDP